MNPSKGLATYAGLVAAVGQYLGAVAVFLGADDPALALGPLLTATATLITVIYGRMAQARDMAASRALAASTPAPIVWAGTTSASGSAGGTRNAAASGGDLVGEPAAPPAEELRDLHENGLT